MYLMKSFADVGGCDVWVRPVLSTKPWFFTYHASKAIKDNSVPNDADCVWSFQGQKNWRTYGIPKATPKISPTKPMKAMRTMKPKVKPMKAMKDMKAIPKSSMKKILLK